MTLVNSSMTISGAGSHNVAPTVERNCSPVERNLNGRNQAGGVENPTDDNAAVMSLIDMPSGKPLTTA